MKGYSYSFKDLGIFSIIIIKSKYCFLPALSLGVTIIMSVLFVTCNNVNAQTLESVTQSRKLLAEGPQIMVGRAPIDIKINENTNKIHVTKTWSDMLSFNRLFEADNSL
jgi:hypothetical protein